MIRLSTTLSILLVLHGTASLAKQWTSASLSPNESYIMVPGSSGFFDLSAPISIIRSRVESILFEAQKLIYFNVHEM